MAIATTFTLAYILASIHRAVYLGYRNTVQFVTGKAPEEIDMAQEVQHFMIMMNEHIMFLEGGPILVRMVAITLEVFLITEDE